MDKVGFNITERFKGLITEAGIDIAPFQADDQTIKYPIERNQQFLFKFFWNKQYHPFLEMKDDFDRLLDATDPIDFPLFRLRRHGCRGVTEGHTAEKTFVYIVKFKKFEKVDRKEITTLEPETKPTLLSVEEAEKVFSGIDREPEKETVDHEKTEPVTKEDKIIKKMNRKIKSKPRNRFLAMDGEEEVVNNGKNSINR
jgi:hypothetical protein